MKSKFSLRSFKYSCGTHDKCLEAIKKLRFPNSYTCPKCNTIQKFYKVTGRTSYACNACGYHIYPLAGTIFDKTTTPLDLWFFAMYLMTQTRSGTSAMQLQRMLGVTYKTAWRIFKQIRLLMAQNPTLLDGIVEIDETFIGGKGKNRRYQWIEGVEEKQKQVVMGMVERGGRAYAKHIPNTGKWALLKQIKDHVSPTARLMTDEYYGYTQLKYLGYNHQFVTHNQTYVVGDIYTQSVENLWSIFKRGIYGVYRVVSPKYLQAYIDEYTWRFNNRQYGGRMFKKLLQQVTEIKPLKIQPALAK